MKELLTNAIKILKGDKISPEMYLALFLLTSATIIVSLLMSSLYKGKYKKAEGTPEKFSFWFLITDNIKRSVVTLFLMFIFYRFLFPPVEKLFSEEFGNEASLISSIGLGIALTFSLDRVFDYVKTKTNFFDDRPRDIQ